MKKGGFWVFILMFLSACAGSPEKEFRFRGEKMIREINQLLEGAENHEELQAVSPRLRKQFRKLAYLLLDVRSFREKNPDASFPIEILEESEILFVHLARLYEIPGCREIMERSQADAVYLLLRDH